MKKILFLPVILFFFSVNAQSDWKQSLHYDLHVKFNPSEKSLDAQMKLDYINHSPDTLTFIWFHVWPNAYRNDRTLYSEQLLENGDTRFYFSTKEQKGYLNRLDFRVNGTVANLKDHPEFIDVIKLMLPKPLLPGDSISIHSSFHLRLPYNFNGFGFKGHHFEVRNWYPEPAVYDKNGWHPMSMLIQGGAYHEAADYDVEIESPPDYLIAAGTAADTHAHSTNPGSLHFNIKNANAFAFVIDNHFILKKDSLVLPDGRQIEIRYFSYSPQSKTSKEIISRTKRDLLRLSERLGSYPHASISIVEASPMPDQDFTGLVCIGQNKISASPVIPLDKALAAQWFQTILLTDQRNQPWLSKGLIDYYSRFLGNADIQTKNNLWLRIAEKEKTTQFVSSRSEIFSTANDSLMPAIKAGAWFQLLKDTLGSNRFDQLMLDFLTEWKFKHPDSADFKSIVDSRPGKNLRQFFDLLNTNKFSGNTGENRSLKPVFIFSAKSSEKYNYIGLAPVPGYNRYDGFMLGALIHNINLPENKFEFLFTPLYAFQSQQLVGLGRMSYSWHPDNHFSRISIGINGSHFNTNRATDSTGRTLFENFSKLVPYIRLDFKPSNPRSTLRRWIDFKSYLINEQSFEDFGISSKDSLTHPNAVTSNFCYVNQLSFNLENGRALYPYDFRAEFQQSELFYRINLQVNYFMNYPDGGGLRLRLFASKFGVWNQNNTTNLARYQPKLLGVNGDEDYLYEDYFIGRSASYAFQDISIPNAGIAAHQIMNRDGGLKLRIDETDYVQGRSGNWVSSLNFSSSLPAHLFPFPVPIRIFFDIGTYAEAWQDNALTSRFLYTGGIQLSLFHNVLNIYAPLFYSADFRDVLIGSDFGKKITFSIDIQNINYKKIMRKAAGS